MVLETAAGAALIDPKPIVEGVIAGFAKTLSRKAGSVAKKVVDETVVDFRIGFKEYLETSYERCRYFKTILDPTKPLEVASHYVHTTLTGAGETLDDDKLISEIGSRKRVVVTGLAGSGKSMFMKYLTVCKFETPRDAVPLFVELRHLNALTEKDLLTYIRSSCTSRMRTFSQEQFDLSLRSGALLLILDGFDEINHESREDIQKQIFQIQKDFPATQIVISSRPDDRFGGWASFFVYSVNKMSKSQCLELIESLEYDLGVKKRFLREVDRRLFDSHKSFLSSPLLTTIMLLTFEEFAEIPQRMHSFYGQAFATLFQKHDAGKEQYQRKTYTGLARDDFKLCTAAFSAFGYLEEQFSFNEEDLLSVAERAVRYAKQASSGLPPGLKAEHLIRDLSESVCMLQKDGLEYSFVHRSFQEYFTAVFATNLHGGRVKKVLDKCALRFNDAVISMALDMARETVEQEWIIPAINELTEQLTLGAGDSIGEAVGNVFRRGHLHASEERLFVTFFDLNEEMLGPLEMICKLYPDRLGSGFIVKPLNAWTRAQARDRLLQSRFMHSPRYGGIQKVLSVEGNRVPLGIAFSTEDDWWLIELGMAERLIQLVKEFSAIKRDIQVRAKRRSLLIDELID